MAGMKECCLDCKERHTACHDFCEKYQKARAEYLEDRKKRWKNSRADREAAAFFVEEQERRRKRGK